MDIAERLAKERRARLAAERLLDQKSRELFLANERLAVHARSLSDQIIEQRHVVQSALTEAEVLKGQNTRFLTDLDRAHTAAATAEQRLWESINTIEDGFAVFDAQRTLVMANRAFLAVFQGAALPPGTSYATMLQLALHHDVVRLGDRTAEDWTQMMLARWDSDQIEPIVAQLSSGNWFKLVDRRAQDGGMVTLALDITEQMRIWAAIEAIPDGFVLFDREDRLLTCNERYRETYPYSAGMIVPGTRFEDILRHGLDHGQHVDAVGREAEWLAERLAQHRLADGVHEQQLTDGRWIRAYDHPTPDGGRVGLRVDITAAKEQQAALEAARLAAEAASRAKSAFLANMSHEIRTPMNGVVGMAELLCDTALSGEQRLFAETIRSSGEALLVIINDILDYSKIEAERLTLHLEPFDLERTIHEVTMLLQPRARAQGVDLLIDFDMFLPTRFVGDPGRVRQVLTNLIGNAVKFTPSGHVLIRVVGLEVGDGAAQLHVTVEDTGIGIAPEYLGHVFGEFNQVESAANRKFEGTGLGLAITRRLIERMGGTVWVDSEPGVGSSFGFQLSMPIAEDVPIARGPLRVGRVLVVDDQFINRTILERQLVPSGIKVVLCRSGADALTVLQEDAAFDVILTDHEMPDMDGTAFAKAVRAGGWTMPIALMTTNAGAMRDDAATPEISTALQKPLLRADLIRWLETLAGSVEVQATVRAKDEPKERRAMRLLAAEDNRTNQLVLRKMIKDFDLELVIANNGREAVDLFQSFRPDLIFMDISMPEMDGREAAMAIRELEAGASHVPICALTAHAMDGDELGILASGIDHYLTKPLRRAEIADVLVRHCPPDARAVLTEAEHAGTPEMA